MNRAFAAVGVIGLTLLTVTTPASAADGLYLCHATGSASNPYNVIQINQSGLHGHDEDSFDIIPPNEFLPDGQNWIVGMTDIHENGCEPVTSPPVDPPVVVVDPPVVVVDPPVVVVDPPVVVVDPPVVVVDPPVAETPVVQSPVIQAPVTAVPTTVQAPATLAATVQTPAGTGAVAVSQGTNQGFNAQTAVGGAESAPTWLAGLGVMLGAGALVAVRRRSQEQAG